MPDCPGVLCDGRRNLCIGIELCTSRCRTVCLRSSSDTNEVSLLEAASSFSFHASNQGLFEMDSHFHRSNAQCIITGGKLAPHLKACKTLLCLSEARCRLANCDSGSRFPALMLSRTLLKLVASHYHAVTSEGDYKGKAMNPPFHTNEL